MEKLFVAVFIELRKSATRGVLAVLHELKHPEPEYHGACIHHHYLKEELLVYSDGLASLIHTQPVRLKYGSKSKLDT